MQIGLLLIRLLLVIVRLLILLRRGMGLWSDLVRFSSLGIASTAGRCVSKADVINALNLLSQKVPEVSGNASCRKAWQP
jgi:hypothetical protein